jgi:hypothetical protein
VVAGLGNEIFGSPNSSTLMNAAPLDRQGIAAGGAALFEAVRISFLRTTGVALVGYDRSGGGIPERFVSV